MHGQVQPHGRRMTTGLVDAAPWIAVSMALLALVVVAWAGWHAWTAWRQVRMTQDAAVALLDVHYTRIDGLIAVAGAHAGQFADDGEELATALGELRANAEHLRWMLRTVPEAQVNLRRELLDLALPSRRPRDGASDDA